MAISAHAELAHRTSRVAGQVQLAPQRNPPKILVVDDEADNRVVLAELLSSAGLTVFTAVDGLDALDRFDAARPDFVFMDLKMPHMDGLEAMRRMRRRPHGKTVPIVALSASVYEQESGVVLRAGANTFIAKPFLEERIWAVLEAELGLSFADASHVAETTATQDEPTRGDLTAFDAATLAALRGALEDGDVDRAGELLNALDDSHGSVVSAFRRRLADFDIAGAIALAKGPGD